MKRNSSDHKWYRRISGDWMTETSGGEGEESGIRSGVVLQLSFLLVGAVILYVSRQLSDSSAGLFTTLLPALGATLIVSAVISLFYSMGVDRRMKKDIRDLGNCIGKLQDTVAVAQGAVDSGLAAVFTNRNDERACKAVKDALAALRLPDEKKKVGGKSIGNSTNQETSSSSSTKKRKIASSPSSHENSVGNEESSSIDNAGLNVRMLGISLGDFLCPHGPCKSLFLDVLKNDRVKLRMLILKDWSRSAVERANREEAHLWENDWSKLTKNPKNEKVICPWCEDDRRNCPGYCDNRCKTQNVDNKQSKTPMSCPYLHTRCHNELKTATDFAEELTFTRKKHHSDTKRETANITEQTVNAVFKFRQYDCAPVAFILILKDTMFVENYHLAGRGGESPMMQISRYQRGTKKPSQLFQTYEKHFEKMWTIAEHQSSISHQEEPEAAHTEGG